MGEGLRNDRGAEVATGATYGYARVSTREQNLDRQIDALRRFGVGERRIVRFGRPPKEKPGSWARTRDEYLAGQMTRRQAAEALGVSPTTFGRWLAGEEEREVGTTS